MTWYDRVTADEIDLKKLSTPEKFRLMDALWQDLMYNNAEIASPAWHGDILRERERMIATGDEAYVDWKTAKQKLGKELKR